MESFVKYIKNIYSKLKIFIILVILIPIVIVLTIADFIYLFSIGKFFINKILDIYKIVAIYLYRKAECRENSEEEE